MGASRARPHPRLACGMYGHALPQLGKTEYALLGGYELVRQYRC